MSPSDLFTIVTVNQELVLSIDHKRSPVQHTENESILLVIFLFQQREARLPIEGDILVLKP